MNDADSAGAKEKLGRGLAWGEQVCVRRKHSTWSSAPAKVSGVPWGSWNALPMVKGATVMSGHHVVMVTFL